MIDKKVIISGLGVVCLCLAVTGQAQTLCSARDIDKVLRAMTLQEKAELLVGSIDANGYFGLPQPTGSDGQGGILVEGAAGQTNSVSRLGVPPTVMADGPAGLRIAPKRDGDNRTFYCTGFPVGIMLSSTWNAHLVDQIGHAMGNEVKEYGVDVLLAPGVNIIRNPLCGRNFEYYSEDPLLAGKMCAAMVRGIQGVGVGTSVKHLAANNQETNRYQNDARVSERALREIYLKPFEIVVKEAKPWTVMSAYNRLNGQFCQTHKWLLTDVLRKEWGFKGIVMTDWSAPKNTSAQVMAGNDLMMPGAKAQVDQLVSDVRAGVLSERDLDVSARRVLEYVVQTPRFKGYHFSGKPDLESHARLVRTASAEGMVLLKNDKEVLPLADTVKTVALFGVTSYRFIAGGTGSGYVHTPYVVSLLQGLADNGYAVHGGLSDVYEKYIDAEQAKFGFSKGAKLPVFKTIGIQFRAPEMSVPAYLPEAVAPQSDAALITIGRESGEGFDRQIDGDFNLSATEQAMIENVCREYHKAGKPVVVILNVGGVIETRSWRDKPDAILLAWQAGQEGGHSVADMLSGCSYPSGRLPVTFPLCYADCPSAADFPSNVQRPDDGMFGYSAVLHPQKRTVTERNIDYTEYRENVEVGYRHYTAHGKAVSYPFGFGLGYTSFGYGDTGIRRRGRNIEATVTVTNTGKAKGKDVVQLYAVSPVMAPMRELKAFAKTRELCPGESQSITLTFPIADLRTYDTGAAQWALASGLYRFMLARNADEPIAAKSIKI